MGNVERGHRLRGSACLDRGGTMDLGEMFRVFTKRWYVALPAVLMALALTAYTYSGIATEYLSQSTLSMLNSPSASLVAPHLGNPFLSFDSSLTPTADFLARRLSSDQSAADLRARGVTESVTAALATNASGPFVTLTVTGTDKAHVLTSMQAFDDYAAQQLQTMQQDPKDPLQTSTLIRSVVIVPPRTPVAQLKSKVENVVAVAAGALVLAFLMVFGFENAAARRAARRAGTEPGAGGGPVAGSAAGLHTGLDHGVGGNAGGHADGHEDGHEDEWDADQGYSFDVLAVADRQAGPA